MNSLVIFFIVGVSACYSSVVPIWGGVTPIGGAVISGPSGTVATKGGLGLDGLGGLGAGAVSKTIIGSPVLLGGNVWRPGLVGNGAIIAPGLSKTVIAGPAAWNDGVLGWSGKGW